MKSIWNNFWASKVSWIFVPAALAFKDWEYFFPLSSHADLRFQVIGEGLEGIALVLIALFFAAKKKELPSFASPTTRLRILAGVAFAAFSLGIYWRDFFPGDHFSLSAGSIDFVYASIAGLVIGSAAWKRTKPVSL